MNKKYNNISLVSGEWKKIRIPCVIFKHRILKSDPTYKFVVNADIYVKSNVAIRNNENSYYYDLLNILAPSSGSTITGTQWLDLLESKYNISLTQGDGYHSSIFPELSFESLADRDLLDILYGSLSSSLYSDGLNVFVDFTLETSGGFVRNKLGIDTNTIKPWLLNDLSFNLLSTILHKPLGSNFRVKDNYQTALELSNNEIIFIEQLTAYQPTLMPKDSDNISYVWNYVNQFSQSLSLSAKQYLFGFFLDKVSITNILNSDFSLNVDSYNRPINVETKNGIYNPSNETITLSIN